MMRHIYWEYRTNDALTHIRGVGGSGSGSSAVSLLRRFFEWIEWGRNHHNTWVQVAAGLLNLALVMAASFGLIVGSVLTLVSFVRYPLLTGIALLMMMALSLPIVRAWYQTRPPQKQRQDRKYAAQRARTTGAEKAMQRVMSHKNTNAETRRLISSQIRYPYAAPYILVDIGVLVYEHETDTPHIARHQPVSLDAAFLRPYIQIWSPQRQTVDIKFLLVDENRTPLFRKQGEYKLLAYKAVVSKSWLPMQGIAVEEKRKWSLCVYIDKRLIAIHHLKWGTFRWRDLKAESPTDGELSKRLTNALKTGQIDTIGLDELLGYEAAEPQKIGRRAS